MEHVREYVCEHRSVPMHIVWGMECTLPFCPPPRLRELLLSRDACADVGQEMATYNFEGGGAPLLTLPLSSSSTELQSGSTSSSESSFSARSLECSLPWSPLECHLVETIIAVADSNGELSSALQLQLLWNDSVSPHITHRIHFLES